MKINLQEKIKDSQGVPLRLRSQLALSNEELTTLLLLLKNKAKRTKQDEQLIIKITETLEGEVMTIGGAIALAVDSCNLELNEEGEVIKEGRENKRAKASTFFTLGKLANKCYKGEDFEASEAEKSLIKKCLVATYNKPSIILQICERIGVDI